LIEWALRVIQQLGYPGIIFAMFLENVFPPIPSEVVLSFAGFLTTEGTFSLQGAVASATLGSVLGALALYGLGSVWGRERLYRFVGRYGPYLRVKQTDILKAEEWFSRYGSGAVFFGRMFPIVRSLISIPAGLSRMRMPVFVIYTAAGTVLWNLLLVTLGAALGTAWAKVATWADYYQLVMIIVLPLLLVGFFCTRRRRRPH